MKTNEFNSLTKEEQQQEIERCKSFEYFYNNYCKKEGMPEFSREVFNDYIESVKKQRTKRSKGDSYFYPISTDKAYKL